MQEKITTSYQKVKAHLIENKRAYITGGICLVIGSLSTAVVLKNDIELEPAVETNILPPITLAPVFNNTPVFNNNFGGYQTKIVKCIETGELWETCKDAAASIGVTPQTFSNHVNGRTDHIYGKHYEVIGMGTT